MVKYSRKHCKKRRNKSRGRKMRGGWPWSSDSGSEEDSELDKTQHGVAQ